jgi:hypothetical protein
MRKRFLALTATLVWACSDSAGPPPPVPTSQLHFVVQDSLAPPLLADSASFYAKVGQDRRLELYYQGVAPGDTGERFLRFEVKAGSLLRQPNGTPFQAGDSILITVSLSDPARFDITFSPPGLQFNPADPARLSIEYTHSNHDFNEDGVVDSRDATTETKLNLWRREPPDTMWTVVGSLKNEELDEIEADIISFTQYAVAW